MAFKDNYALVIIGIGPAGLTASVYASRYLIDHLLIGENLGGSISKASAIENYPGYKSISGLALAQEMEKHVQSLGTEIWRKKVHRLFFTKKDKHFKLIVEGEEGKEKTISAKAVILASGTERRTLKIPGEQKFMGRGVSYCSTCDASFFKNKDVAVIGGSGAAIMSAFHLADFAKQVFLIYRKDKLKGEPIWEKKLKERKNVKIIYNTVITKINGAEVVTSINLKPAYQGEKELKLAGVFIEIGYLPSLKILKRMKIKLDAENFIKVNAKQETNLPGLFAAGDITNGSNNFRQVITAASEGAIAAKSAYDFLNTKNDR